MLVRGISFESGTGRVQLYVKGKIWEHFQGTGEAEGAGGESSDCEAFLSWPSLYMGAPWKSEGVGHKVHYNMLPLYILCK